MKNNKRSKVSADKSSASPETVLAQKASLKRLSRMMAIFCAALGLLLYVNTLGHNYTVDDDTVMQKNKIVKKGLSAVPEIFTTSYRKGFWDRKEAMYRPMSLVMFAAEWQIAPAKPFVGHLVNILLYALTGFVLFIALRTMLSMYSLLIPFIATLLFIAHPLHTEVVASIKSRDELLSFLFLILSLYFLFSYWKDKKKVSTMITSVFCFLIALLSKESAVTFLAIFPLALFFFTDIPLNKIIRCCLLFIIPLGIYFALRANALQGLSNTTEILPINNSLVNAPDIGSRIATAITILGKYLGLLIFPHPLSFDYSYNQIPNVSFADLTALFCLVVFAGMVIYALATLKKKNIFSFCILYFLVTISLVSNILFLIESTMAERFLYTSSVAFCIALPLLFCKLFKVDPKKFKFHDLKTFFSASKPIPVVMIFLLLLYSFKTISRNKDWKSNYILLKKDVQSSPNSARIRYALGSEILLKQAMDEKDPFKKNTLLDESITQLERGVAILPTYGEAFYNLGLAYTGKNDSANAVRSFEAAKQSKKWDEAEFYVSSGLAYAIAKRYESAFAEFKKATEIDPKQKEAYNNWGLYLSEAGRNPEAIEKLNKAIEIDPEFVSAWYNKGNAYAQSGDFKQAITCYEKAISIDPKYTDGMVNIGNSYAAMKDYEHAIEYFEKVLAIDPSNYNAISNIAVSYRFMGNEQKAEEYRKMLPEGK